MDFSTNRYLHIAIILIVGIAVYSNAFSSPFVLDDILYVVDNQIVEHPSTLSFLSESRFFGYLSFAMNHAIGGWDVVGFNITNIIIHLLAGVLVYWLVLLIFATPTLKEGTTISASRVALVAALLFVVHPIATQPVNYITQRFASLATLFYLLSICLYVSARLSMTTGRGAGRLGGRALVFYILAFVVALMAQKTKEIAFTLPFMIVFYEFTFLSVASSPKGARGLGYALPFLVLVVVIPFTMFAPEVGLWSESVYSAAAHVRKLQLEELSTLSRSNYFVTEMRVIVTYIRLLLLPIEQNLLYHYPSYRSFAAPAVIVSMLFLLSIVLGSIWLYIRSRKRGTGTGLVVAFGLCWFFITLSVESSVVPIKHVIFEHRVYLPYIGPVISFAVLYFLFVERYLSGTLRYVPIVVVLVIFSVATYSRNNVWADKITLWKDVVEKSPALPDGYIALGKAYDEAEMLALAIETYEEAIRIAPNAPMTSFAFHNVGKLRYDRGDLSGALDYYMKALALYENNYQAHNNIAGVFTELGRPELAIRHYEEALRIMPNNADLSYNLAGIYHRSGDTRRAAELYGKAIRLNVGHVLAHYALGVLYQQSGDFEGALSKYRDVLALDPAYVPAMYNSGIISFQRGEPGLAIGHFSAAVAADPDGGDAHFNLALVYYKTGKLDMAARHYEESLRVAPSVDAYLNLAIVYAELGERRQALVYFKKVMELDPGNSVAKDWMEKISSGTTG